MRLSEIVIKGINSGSKLAFLGLTLALTVNSFNHLTEGKYAKPIPYKDCEKATSALILTYFLAEGTEKYKLKEI